MLHPHTSLKTSRGIIRCPDLAGAIEEETVSNLASQHVIAARLITIKRNTNTIVQHFSFTKMDKSWIDLLENADRYAYSEPFTVLF